MKYYSAEEYEEVSKQGDKIRNVCIIGPKGHGKATLLDSILVGASILGTNRRYDTRRDSNDRMDEQSRILRMATNHYSVLFNRKEEDFEDDTIVNFINFSSDFKVNLAVDTIPSLRISDGVFVTVDCVEGINFQTEILLRFALQERIKPVLIINKLDRLLLELQAEFETIYGAITEIIISVNKIISSCCDNKDWILDPLKGNVVFASGLMGFAFNLPQFAQYYGKRTMKKKKLLGETEELDMESISNNILKNLWGARYINPETGKVSNKKKFGFTRGFCELVIRPLQEIYNCCQPDYIDWPNLDNILLKLEITLTDEDKDLKFKQLIKRIFKHWFTAHISLLDVIITHLPSPKQAQQYRTTHLYTHTLNSDVGSSIMTCDNSGPLVIFISKIIESPQHRKDYFCFSRVFSGTVENGNIVRVIDENGNDSQVRVYRLLLMNGHPITTATSVSAGNLCVLLLRDTLSTTSTLGDENVFHPILPSKYNRTNVVSITVEPTVPNNYGLLVNTIRRLTASEPIVTATTSDNGDLVLSSISMWYLKQFLDKLKNNIGGEKVKYNGYYIEYRETVTDSGNPSLAKSPNKKNRICTTACPLDEHVLKACVEKKIQYSNSQLKLLADELQNTFEWNYEDAEYCLGFYNSEGNRCNTIINHAQVEFINEVLDSIKTGVEWVTNSGPLTESPLHGVRFDIKDIVLHADPLRRGAGQIIPTVRRALLASILSACPRMLEPIYLVEIYTSISTIQICYELLDSRNSSVFEETMNESGDIVTLKAYLPVAKSLDFADTLLTYTSGKAIPQLNFHHYDIIPGNPYEKHSPANDIVVKIRKDKGLIEILPTSNQYADNHHMTKAAR